MDRPLSLVVIALSAAILGVGLRRLSLYDDAFGLTMLRLASQAGAYYMAALLLLLAGWVGWPECAHVGTGSGASRRWFPGAVLITLILGAAAFAAVNPEAIVVTNNLARSGQGPLDREYLLTLSSDATPQLVQALGKAACGPIDDVDWRLWTVADAAARKACAGVR